MVAIFNLCRYEDLFTTNVVAKSHGLTCVGLVADALNQIALPDGDLVHMGRTLNRSHNDLESAAIDLHLEFFQGIHGHHRHSGGAAEETKGLGETDGFTNSTGISVDPACIRGGGGSGFIRLLGHNRPVHSLTTYGFIMS